MPYEIILGGLFIMDSSFYLFTGVICLVIGIVFALVAYSFFRRFKKLNDVMNSALEMTATASGSISSLEKVRRRNRSFRWTNEYPIITYTVDGRSYTVSLDYAEKRAGHYSLGGDYHVYYNPSDPSCCIVDEFRKPMSRMRTQSIIMTVIFAFFTFNLVVSTLSTIYSAFI